ncbi:hypothetical protein ES703_108114 [subsurface metagenome]
MLEAELQKKIIEYLLPLQPEKVILFGSYGYGKPNKESDIDLLVIKDIPKNKVREYRLQIKKILWQKFNDENIYFDVLVDNEKRISERIKIGDLFYQEIYNNGQVIYA